MMDPLTPSMNFSFEKLSNPIESLPLSSFHVVVFSLLLEYLPCPKQRWKCCRNAHKLLATNGLLVVMTPDSHHVGKNAKMMKSWKAAIESIGFRRWRYEKMEHIHCMAFRKVEEEGSSEGDRMVVGDKSGVDYAQMLYIPQDYNDGDRQREEKKAVGKGEQNDEKSCDKASTSCSS